MLHSIENAKIYLTINDILMAAIYGLITSKELYIGPSNYLERRRGEYMRALFFRMMENGNKHWQLRTCNKRATSKITKLTESSKRNFGLTWFKKCRRTIVENTWRIIIAANLLLYSASVIKSH